MTSTVPAIRLHVGDPLATGGAVTLGRAQAHYLRNVMRAKAGDGVLLFNGRDGEWRAELAELGKAGGAARCVEQTRPQRAAPDLWLLFAPIKSGRIEFLVEKATELGVSAPDAGRDRAHRGAADQCRAAPGARDRGGRAVGPARRAGARGRASARHRARRLAGRAAALRLRRDRPGHARSHGRCRIVERGPARS